MESSMLIQFVLSGLTTGAIYAVIALGFTLIYSSSDVINFAQGEFVMIGGMTTAILVEAQKKAHEAKLKQKVISVKEVKFRPGTDDGDYNIKLRNLIRFLDEGDKTKITLRFRGREMAHQEIGMRMLERLKVDLEPYGQIEQFPKMEGRQMIMVLAPKKKK